MCYAAASLPEAPNFARRGQAGLVGIDAAFGPTRAGRLLVIVFAYRGGGRARVITGWDMREPSGSTIGRSGGREPKARGTTVEESVAEYYKRRGVLRELLPQRVAFALDGELRRQILRGHRSRRLQNLSIKLDPGQIQALRKIATRMEIVLTEPRASSTLSRRPHHRHPHFHLPSP